MGGETTSDDKINPRCFADIVKVAEAIRGKVNLKEKPRIGIVCGSGLGDIGDCVKDPQILSYNDIPGFSTTKVIGHKGNLVFGFLGGRYVVCMQGRFHPYEHDMDLTLCAMPVRVLHQLGIEVLVVSNAAGGARDGFSRGDLMLITDHIFLPALAGHSPLIGLTGEVWGARFVSLANQYDADLRKKALEVAEKQGLKMQQGVYVMTGGPQYESAAEIEYLKRVGGDALGMSTCHEVVAARQCGVKVLGMSLISNIANSSANPTHAEVLETAREASKRACKFVEGFCEALQL